MREKGVAAWLAMMLVAIGCCSCPESLEEKRFPVDVVLTFDDWIADHYDIVVPELEKRGWRGVFCVVPRWVGGPESAGWGRLRDILQRGHVVANHTYSHKALGDLCLNGKSGEARADIVRGRDALEQFTGVRPKLLCLPGTNYAPEVGRIAEEEGQIVMLIPRSCYGAWNKDVSVEIDDLYAKGVRRADFLVHGIRPEGGGWMPFPSVDAFVGYLDSIKEAERAGKVRIVTDYQVAITQRGHDGCP